MLEDKKEYNNLKEKYVNGAESYKIIGNINEVLLNKVIYNTCSFERPDMYSVVDDTAYIIEHFEFGPYKANKKGNEYNLNVARIEKEFNDGFMEEKKYKSDNFNLDFNPNLFKYRDSFLKAYNNHYNNVIAYKNNINKITGLNKMKIWFFAEDISPFGTCVEKNGIKVVIPIDIKEICEKIKESSLLEGIVYAVHVDGKNELCFIKKDAVEDYSNKFGFVDLNSEVIFTNPKMMLSNLIL